MGKVTWRTVCAAAAFVATAFSESEALKTENKDQDGVLAANSVEIEENDELLSIEFLENENSTESCAVEDRIASLGSERLISLTSIETPAKCQEVCHDIAECVAAVYQPTDSVCHLLKELKNLQPAKGTLILLGTCDASCFKSKKTLKGTATPLGEVPSANFCQALCAGSDACVAFSWNITTKECLSFSANTGYKGSSRYISGEKKSCVTRKRARNYAGTCSQQNTATNVETNANTTDNVGSFEECHDLCLKRSDCNWVDYGANEKKCWMKKFAGPLKQLSNVTTAPKFCDSSCFWKNIQIKSEEDQKLSNIPDVHRCHYECMMGGLCKHWSFNENNGECTLHTSDQITGVYASGYWTGIRGGCGSEAAYSERLPACAVKGIKYSGEVLETSTQGDATQCQEFCKGNDYCQAFSFNKETKECRALPASAVNTREEDASYVSGARYCNISCLEYDVQRTGKTVGTFPNGAANSDECKLRCQASSECTHYSFTPSTKNCVIYRSEGTTKAAGVISGRRSCNDVEIANTEEGNCDISGYEAPKMIWSRELSNKGLEDCRNECKWDNNCITFTHYGNERKCLLADWFSLRGQRERAGATLGFRSCSYCIRPNVGFKASSPEFLYGTMAQNAEECRQRCDLQQMCYRFSFNKSTKACYMFSGSPSKVERGPNLYSGAYRCNFDRSCMQYGKRINNGTLLETKAISDEGQCQEACGAHPACTWWSYSFSGTECKLYFGQITIDSQNGVVVGPKKCMRDPKETEMCEEKGVQFEDGVIKDINHIGFAPLCAEECKKEPRCRLWTLNKQMFWQHCFLYTINNFRSVTHHNYKTSGGRDGCPRCIRQGVAILGNVIKTQNVRNAMHCQFACELEASCNNFTFDGSNCTLRSSFERAISANNNTYSGPKQC